ncbi:MAG: UDP-N-acetylmuramoyl-tripeptide--D-alanyl-D-alanine ligase [Bacteroidetes bacterium]|nr:MAG: UDP-N-acetylmuramoyl-tripeptide--D-alanyl-D-alanine ligase [Bacteroidota bacterium]
MQLTKTTAELYHYYQQHPRVTTDTRQLQPGDLFVALKGDRFDGNQFAATALASGAAYAIVDDPQVAVDARYLLVEDTLQALQDLARHHRRQFRIPVLAITGSNGKTTTKELVAAVLSMQYPTHFTRGNLNNHIGVPLTLLSMPLSTELAVVEMGANHQGEIAALCEIAEPTHGLITNIGEAHLEGFGGIEGVKKGKSELYRYLAANKGVAFINADEDFLDELATPVAKKIHYRVAAHPSLEEPYFELRLHALQPQLKVSFIDAGGTTFMATTHLSGQHNLQNVNTAVAVGKYFKVPADKIVQALEAYRPQSNRSQWLDQDGVHYLLDAYNANPSSMAASLRNFAALPGPRKLVILGEMLELGASSEEAHWQIAKLTQELPFTAVWLVGPAFAPAAKALKLPHFTNAEAVRAVYDPAAWQGARVMLKGSRGVALEQILSTHTQ